MTKYGIKKMAFSRARAAMIKIRAGSCGPSFSTHHSCPVTSVIAELSEKFAWVFLRFGVFFTNCHHSKITVEETFTGRVFLRFLSPLSFSSVFPNSPPCSAAPGHTWAASSQSLNFQVLSFGLCS